MASSVVCCRLLVRYRGDIRFLLLLSLIPMSRSESEGNMYSQAAVVCFSVAIVIVSYRNLISVIGFMTLGAIAIIYLLLCQKVKF